MPMRYRGPTPAFYVFMACLLFWAVIVILWQAL